LLLVKASLSKKQKSIGAAIALQDCGWGKPAPQQDFPLCAFWEVNSQGWPFIS
jgi:hypothetical protein